jgi:hypothetical protein
MKCIGMNEGSVGLFLRLQKKKALRIRKVYQSFLRKELLTQRHHGNLTNLLYIINVSR